MKTKYFFVGLYAVITLYLVYFIYLWSEIYWKFLFDEISARSHGGYILHLTDSHTMNDYIKYLSIHVLLAVCAVLLLIKRNKFFFLLFSAVFIPVGFDFSSRLYGDMPVYLDAVGFWGTTKLLYREILFCLSILLALILPFIVRQIFKERIKITFKDAMIALVVLIAFNYLYGRFKLTF